MVTGDPSPSSPSCHAYSPLALLPPYRRRCFPTSGGEQPVQMRMRMRQRCSRSILIRRRVQISYYGRECGAVDDALVFALSS
uniref:Uncharacterized protein n=1 Tax=Oryza punctata TaxID=4537 RepID=A0A0E0LSP0_ORYPU